MSNESPVRLRVRGFREGTQFTVANNRPGSEVGSRTVVSGRIDPNDAKAIRHLREQGYDLEIASGDPGVFDLGTFFEKRRSFGIINEV